MKTKIIFFCILLFTSTVYAQEIPEKVFCDKSKSTITYSMRHPLHKWDGVSKEITSVILTDSKHNKISQVAVSVKIASFDSKNANRDSHTMEVTEALEFPSITFNSTSIEQNGEQLKVVGTLSFHNFRKEISFEANSKKENGKLRVNGIFTILMSEFGIDPPKLMAMSTDDDIKIEFDVLY